MYMRMPTIPLAVVHATWCSRYPLLRDDEQREDEGACAMARAASAPEQLLTALQWIVPGRSSDCEAALQLLRLRQDFTIAQWDYALDQRRPPSLFQKLAVRLRSAMSSREPDETYDALERTDVEYHKKSLFSRDPERSSQHVERPDALTARS
jgi:hypothetical protein